MVISQAGPSGGNEIWESRRNGDIPGMTTITAKEESICRYVLRELRRALLKFIKRYMKDFVIRGTTMEFCYSGISKGIETFTETLVPVIRRVSTDDRVFRTGHIVYQAKTLPNGQVLPFNFDPTEVRILTAQGTGRPVITASLVAERALGGWDGTIGNLAYEVIEDYHVLKNFNECPVRVFLKETELGSFELHYISIPVGYFLKQGKSLSLTRVMFLAPLSCMN